MLLDTNILADLEEAELLADLSVADSSAPSSAPAEPPAVVGGLMWVSDGAGGAMPIRFG